MHNFFEAKDRKLKAHRAENGSGVFGRGSEPPHHQLLWGLGERCKLSSRVWGKAPATNAFWCILSLKIAYGGNFFDNLFQLKKWK